jgi:hypothetical protein
MLCAWKFKVSVAGLVGLVMVPSALSAATVPDRDGEDGPVPKAQGKGFNMDYRPFLCYTINCKTAAKGDDNLAIKGIAIRLAQRSEAAVCFDTELMRYAAGWTNGFLDISKTHLTSYKGSQEAFIDGTIQFSTKAIPGWARKDQWADPRPLHAGPLPADWAKFTGLHRHGDEVILNYSVGGAEIFELPGFEATNGLSAFTRTFHIGKTDLPLTLYICEVQGGNVSERLTFGAGANRIIGKTAKNPAFCGIVSPAASDAMPELTVEEGTRLQCRLPASPVPRVLKVVVSNGSLAEDGAWARSWPWERTLRDPKQFCHGGPSRWTNSITTKGRLGFATGPYVVDTLTVPESNPWKSWMRFVAFDFFSDGRAAISTWNGDVWIVSGIDDKLENLTWKRFAAGLFEPLGLKIVDDQVFVLCRDRLARLHDLDHDGEADFYESFNSDAPAGPSYHAFAFDLQTDRAGNFYYTRCGQRVDPALPLNGGMVKVSKDGTKAELIARGLRAANGVSIGPHEEITCSDNQGNWIPSSRINLIKRDGFYGYVPHARAATVPTDYEKPICWIPQAIDNSSGGQVWVTSDQWGPLKGQLLHTSYGKGTLFLVLMEQIDGQAQGGVVQFPLKFESGIMRGRFHPRDGQLYVCGLKGWQTAGVRDAAFQRVRYAGKALRMPCEMHVTHRGIEVKFTCALDESSATDEQNYAIEQWNYKWSEDYGSPDFSVINPNAKGRDPVAVKSIQLGPDRKSVFLEIPELRPVMQMKIQFRIKADDGSPIAYEIYNTINRAGHGTTPAPQGIR